MEEVQYASSRINLQQLSKQVIALTVGQNAFCVSVNKEEQTVYSEVAVKPGSASRAPPPDPSTADGQKGRPRRALILVTVCLCVLLIGSIAALSFLTTENQRLSSEMSHLQSSSELLMQESARLKDQRAELQNLTLDLTRERDRLNWTLQVIMTYDQFPVAKLCPQKQCQPCMEGWVHFENSCYFFYEPKAWKTWRRSQTYCRKQSPTSDLVIVDSLQEQEFLHKHIQFYFDMYHGYWMGLSLQDDRWVWVDRRTDALGFWMEPGLGTAGPKALVIPDQNPTMSWDPAEETMLNKFICESKALTID